MSIPEWIIDNRTQYNRQQWQGAGNSHEFIAMHYLGVPNANNPNLYNNGFGGHYYISTDGKVYWSADEDQVIWHVGASSGFSERHPNGWSPTNRNTIGIEMGVCKDNPISTNATDPDWYYTKETQEAAVKLVKYLMEKFGIKADHVLRHGDITTKRCPAPWFNTTNEKRHRTNWTWEEFKAKLVDVPKTETKTSYSVVLPELSSRTHGGAYSPFTVVWQCIMRSREVTVGESDEICEVDGYFGKKSTAFTKEFQRRSGIPQTGNVDRKTWTVALGLTNGENVSGGAIRMTLKQLTYDGVKKSVYTLFAQEIMKAFDLYLGDLDRIAGIGTINGTKMFQEILRLDVDGIWGPACIKRSFNLSEKDIKKLMAGGK